MGHIYIIQFDGVLTKVGRSRAPKQRLLTHTASYRNISGGKMTNYWVSLKPQNTSENEKKLISFCRDNGDQNPIKSEWFFNIDFEKLVLFAESLSFDSFYPKIERCIESRAFNALWDAEAERQHVHISYQLASNVEKYAISQIGVSSSLFSPIAPHGVSAFVSVLAAYFATGNPMEMIPEAMECILCDDVSEGHGLMALYEHALSVVRANMEHSNG